MSLKPVVASRPGAHRPLALIVAMFGLGGAWAQSGGSPYHIGVSQGFGHQTNLFGAPSSGTRVPDKYSITSLLGGVDLKLSRQRLYANGVVRANRYEDVKLLNNDAYGLNVGLDWETIGDLTGTLRLSANRSLASYTTPGAPLLDQTRNIETTNLAQATVRYGITRRVAVTGSLQRREVDFSARSFAAGELTQNEASVGVRYGLPGQLVLGVGVRQSKTDRPRQTESPVGSGTYLSNESDRRDLDLTADWSPTGLSTLTARLSHGREEHTLASIPGFEGTTGALGWVYTPTDKTSFNLSVSRDTGTASSFAQYEGNAQPLEIYTNRLTNRVRAGMTYNPTAKIRLNAALREARTKSDAVTGARTDDRVSGASLAASYAYSRSVSFNCGIDYDRRETAGDEFANRTVVCAGQLTMR